MGLLFATAVPAAAHHAFGGEFDPNRPILLKGKIVKIEWVNPHSWIHVEVTKPDGAKEVWMVEGGSPNSLLRHGVTKTTLPVGTEIIVDGYQSRPGIVGHGTACAKRRQVFKGLILSVLVGSASFGQQPNHYSDRKSGFAVLPVTTPAQLS